MSLGWSVCLFGGQFVFWVVSRSVGLLIHGKRVVAFKELDFNVARFNLVGGREGGIVAIFSG